MLISTERYASISSLFPKFQPKVAYSLLQQLALLLAPESIKRSREEVFGPYSYNLREKRPGPQVDYTKQGHSPTTMTWQEEGPKPSAL